MPRSSGFSDVSASFVQDFAPTLWTPHRPARPEKAEGGKAFKLVSDYSPAGDQPVAIAELVEGIGRGDQDQVLLGVTGSGKTFTMAKVIEQTQRPALILAHNKTLAAQLYSEFKSFFPDNAVEYFVSYYDYYQPEAYVPRTDTYIEKDSSINEQIDRMRHSATRAILERDDVIVVASVSCIYGIGSVETYTAMTFTLKVGDRVDEKKMLADLVAQQYAKVVGQSWRYVNKNGGPDRRFNNNHVVQIILLHELTFQSPTGLEIILQASATKAALETVEALRSLAPLPAHAAVTSGSADRPGRPPEQGAPRSGSAGQGNASHRCNSVRLLQSAATWRDVDVAKFMDAVARDGATKSGKLSEDLLVTFLSDFRDLFCEFDRCTVRTSDAFGVVAMAELGAIPSMVRAMLLRSFAGGVAKIRDQLSDLPPDDWRELRTYIADLADDPGQITRFHPELLG